MLARAGSLDGGIQRQQVGLLGNVVDGLDHRADLLTQRAQLAHLAGRLADDGLDLGHGRGRLAHRLAAVLGRYPGLLAGGGDLVGIGGHFFDSGCHPGRGALVVWTWRAWSVAPRAIPSMTWLSWATA